MNKYKWLFPLMLGIGIATVILIMCGRNFRIDVPFSYSGYDETSYMSEVKMMLDDNSWLHSNYLGAPLGTDRTNRVSYYLFNDVHILSFIFVKITGSVGSAVNLTYFTLLFLCGYSTYFVFIQRKINGFLAVLGALTYTFMPYVLFRGIDHIMLSAYYVIPLAYMICLWIFEDDNYLKIEKSFFSNKRNCYGVLLAFLFANNGTGYYPMFTSFFLLMAGLSKAIKKKKLTGLIQAITQIGLIVFWMIVSLINYFISVAVNGKGVVIPRLLVESELFSLRIMRLIMPISSTGSGWLDAKIQSYRDVMVYDYESTEFLGLIGVIGLIVLILYLFVETKGRTSEIKLFSEMTIISLIYATLGGFGILFSLFFTDMARCTSRISIYIAFMCIYSVCFLVTDFVSIINERGKKKWEPLVYVVFAIISLAGLYNQVSSFSLNNVEIAGAYDSDKRFIECIEQQLPEGAMVYELPGHGFPDTCERYNMAPYELLIPYLHSHSLKWSYGAGDMEDSGIFNVIVSSMDTEKMLDNLYEVGYKGIYINTRGYEDGGLQIAGEFTAILGSPTVSEDGEKLFFKLQ